MNSNFDYAVCADGIRLTGYHGDAIRVMIPTEIGGLPVRVIGTHTFYDDGIHIESITVPGTVRKIEPYAFELCLSLTELILNEGLEEIGAGAFQATALESVRIPESIQRIDGIAGVPCTLIFTEPTGDATDSNGQITEKSPGYESDGFGIYYGQVLVGANSANTPVSYEIKRGTTSVAPDVFADCGALEALQIPASLTELPEGVLINVRDPFSLDRGIHNITVEAGNPCYRMQEGMLLRRILMTSNSSNRNTDAENVYFDEVEPLELVRYVGDQKDVVIPEQVRRIAPEAFLRSGIRRVVIPASVQSIGADAFLENPLEEAMFLAGAEKLRAWSVYFPQSDSYLLKNLLKGFGAGGKRYDFTTYDEVLSDRHLNLDRVRMACSRLEHEVDLLPGQHAALWASVLGRLEEIVALIAMQNDLPLLKQLEQMGFLSEQNIDRLIRAAASPGEQISRGGKLDGRRQASADLAADGMQKETMVWLMDWKHRTVLQRTTDFWL